MRPLRLYLDTSVIGGCFDDEFKVASLKLMDELRGGGSVGVISDIVLQELVEAPPDVSALVTGSGDIRWEFVEEDYEAEELAQRYLDAGVVSPRFRNDCRHVAVATVCEVDVLVSWNFRHIVRYDKIRMFNAVNLAQGYRTLEIRSPLEVVRYEE
ncbi:MAG: PIN domain protein [Verrucomicrobia bacterium]|nr:PIN domain protein [Verrucomicrobiota bacterium]MBU1693354.1 PIN domain protein [Verrucomicrobiota bacterium]